jgi:hypothetical protein
VKAQKKSRDGQILKVLAVAAGALGVFAAIGLASPTPARAALGGDPLTPPQGSTTANSVVHAAVAASGASSASTTNYTVRSTTLASGTVINEYVSSEGTVFGIAWHGPRVPDLQTLLGSYFPTYQQSMQAQRTARGGRGQVNVQDTGLVVTSGGHMGAFRGSAYLPQSLPAGVSASDIQ